MGLGNAILAGVGGAAKGIGEQQRFDQKQAQQIELERMRDEIRQMIASMGDATKREDIKSKRETADANRTAKADEVRQKLELAWSGQQQTGDLGWDRNRIAEQGQSDTNDRFWGGTVPLGYDRTAATREGQQIVSGDRRRGQDMTSATAAAGRSVTMRGQDMGAATAAAGQSGATDRSRARNVMDVLRLKQRSDASLAGDETDFANEFDRLYNDPNAMGGEAARAVAGAPAPVPAMATPAASPGAPATAPTRAPLPVPVRPQSNAAPAADPRAALATQLVTLTKQITTMPPGPARENAKKQLAALRAQAETLRTPAPGQD